MKKKVVGIVLTVTLVLGLSILVHAGPGAGNGGEPPPTIGGTSAPLPPPCNVPEK